MKTDTLSTGALLTETEGGGDIHLYREPWVSLKTQKLAPENIIHPCIYK